MQQLRRNTVSRGVSYLLVMVLLAPQSLFLLPAAAQTAGQNVPAVVVVPFQDQTGKAGSALMREATAASALALEDSKEYVVISTTDLDRELAALHMSPPLSTSQQVRLGERLHADKVLVGTLAALSVDAGSGRARAELHLMLLDVAIGEYLDGAVASIETRAIPGFAGDVAAVTHEALREVSEAAVNKMLSATIRRGTVELVDDQGNVNVNLGTDDGLSVGSELLVVRPTWQPDVEQVIMRRIGIIRLMTAESNLGVARRVEGALPTTGDRLYRIYKPVSAQQVVARQKRVKSGLQLVAAGLLLLGLVAVATGPTTASGSTLQCGLAQASPGSDPVVRLDVNTDNTALDKTHGWLIYRAANNPDFPAIAQYLIDAMPGQRMTVYSDEPFEYRVIEDYELTFQFLEEGELEDGSVTVSFNDAPLVRGTRYFYRVRRIIEPLARPGENPPIGTAQIEPVEPVIEPDPDDSVLSEASNACGPVTFFTSPLLSTPDNGSASQRTDAITFTWQPSVGANEYRVQVFPTSDPDGLNAPILQSSVVRDNGAAILNATIQNFAASTTYWWRVGARQSSDARMPLNLMTGVREWLYSSMRSFTTANTPPSVPGTADLGGKTLTVPNHHGGWWGGDRRNR
ncbi:MAG: hypothetical protein KKI08_07830 [Armatimonadetes bacterium]|nr:hypothetical protein [Armatimonadota bacterium]